MAPVNTLLFNTEEIAYSTCTPSRQCARKTRKTVHLGCAKTPSFIPSIPVSCKLCSSQSLVSAMEERLKQGWEIRETLLCHLKARGKFFPERRWKTVPKALVEGHANVGDLVNQICTSIQQDDWEETKEIETLRSMKNDSRAKLVVEVLRLQTNAKKALEFFQWAGHLEEYEHHTDSYSIIVEILGIANMLDAAQAIIHQMKNKGYEVSLIIFNSLIRWYGEHGKIKEALDVFDFIKSEGYVPSTRAYNNILIALVRGKEFEMAESIYVEMLGYGVPMNRRTFTTMIHCLCMRNKLEEAKDMLDNMDTGCAPNVVTYTALISGFCKRGKMTQAFEILEKMQRHGCNPSVMTYTSIINGLCLVGKVEQALGWLKKMHDKGCSPDIYSYSVLMDGLCKVGRTDEAKELLTEALGRGLRPTIVSYNSLFYGYFKEGRTKEALSLLDEISHKDVEPTIITYTILVHGLVKWRRIQEAVRLHDEITDKGYVLDHPTMSALVHGLCRKGNSKDASRLFRKIQDMDQVHDHHTYYMVIRAHLLAGEMQEAVTLFTEMVRNNCNPKTRIYNEVMYKLCVNGRIDNAINMLNFMTENGRKPNVISYNILLEQLYKEGRMDTARQLYAAAMKRGLFSDYRPQDLVQFINELPQEMIGQGM